MAGTTYTTNDNASHSFIRHHSSITFLHQYTIIPFICQHTSISIIPASHSFICDHVLPIIIDPCETGAEGAPEETPQQTERVRLWTMGKEHQGHMPHILYSIKTELGSGLARGSPLGA
jgi:hypothetical protein